MPPPSVLPPDINSQTSQFLRPRAALKPLTPEQMARACRILDRFGVPPEEREVYLDGLAALVEVALAAHFGHGNASAGLRAPSHPPRSHPQSQP